jgi:hypothetical protein
MSSSSPSLVLPLLMAAGAFIGSSKTATAQLRLTPVVHRPKVLDVSLCGTGVLEGQFLDAEGHPAVGVRVTAWQGQKMIHQTATDAQGHFSFTGLSGGVYRVECNGQFLDCRVWTPELAPPQSKDLLVLIRHESAGRGTAADFMLPGPTAITSALTNAALSVFSKREIRSPNSP